MSEIEKEAENITARYAKRNTEAMTRLYNPMRLANLLAAQQRDRAVARLLARHLGDRALSDLEILEIGCGSGDNLLQMLRLGADPRKLRGNDLLVERVNSARLRLPEAARLHTGDAQSLGIAPESLDLVMQYTVFSSILSPEIRHNLAGHMQNWLRPGGAIVWYDFIYDNPRNLDVVGIKMAEIKALFAGYDLDVARVTLAPPIARRVDRIPLLHNILGTLPFLRTHVVCVIRKPDAKSAPYQRN